MQVFYILQILGDQFLKICQVSYKLSFSFLLWNSWGTISWYPCVCRYCTCKVSIINFIKCNGRLAQWDVKSTCISKFLTTDLFIIFTGMRFGLMQVKTGLCHILSRFEVAPCKEMPLPIVYETKSFLMQMHGKFRLSFNRVQFWTTYIYLCTIELKYRHK